MKSRGLRPIPPGSPRIERLAAGLAAYEVAAATGLSPTRISIIERHPIEARETELRAYRRALAKLIARGLPASGVPNLGAPTTPAEEMPDQEQEARAWGDRER